MAPFCKPALIFVLFSVATGCQREMPSGQPIHGKSTASWSQDLHNANLKVRVKAVQALGNAGAIDPAILQLLMEALKDRSALVRLEAVLAIEKMGQAGSEALPALKLLLKDPDPKVRDQAAKAVKQLET
jgi:HEAT repeat protein